MEKTCKKCGGTVKMEDAFCTHCGTPLEKEEPIREEYGKTDKQDGNTAEVLSMGDYLLILILLAIPVVNIIACIIWIVGENGNPNRRNFAKAWLIITVIGTILSSILAFGAIQFIMDPIVDINQPIEYSIPEQQFIDNFLMELNEV